MIKDFLAKLGANTKITIGVSVSPGVGLEMIEIDSATKTVSKYGCKPLEYNYFAFYPMILRVLDQRRQ